MGMGRDEIEDLQEIGMGGEQEGKGSRVRGGAGGEWKGRCAMSEPEWVRRKEKRGGKLENLMFMALG